MATRNDRLFTAVLAASILAAGALVVAPASAGPAPGAPRGGTSADARGMKLYVLRLDAAAVRRCRGGCAVAWRPLTAAEAAVVARRDDGEPQRSRHDRSPYRGADDAAPAAWETAAVAGPAVRSKAVIARGLQSASDYAY